MDFVKFYIVQLVKNAASRIRLIDKEKEKLLSRLVARIENSQELFPDLKMMERVIELEEAASKLISIYRRLNKSHIDLEKISYQFASDRDAIQSILRRFLQGNFRNGIVKKKRPKIVFDDTTFTIYELKEPEEVEVEENTTDEELKPKVDLMEFLKSSDEKIISLESETVSDKIEMNELEGKTSDKGEQERPFIDEKLEIENGIAKKSLKKTEIEKEKQKVEQDLVLPLDFDWNDSLNKREKSELTEQIIPEKDEANELSEKILESKKTEAEISVAQIPEETSIKEPQAEHLHEITNENLDKELQEEQNSLNQFEKETTESENSISEEEEIVEESQLSEQIIKSMNESNDNLYLDFERLVLDNILEVDEFLSKILTEQVDSEQSLKLIQKAYKSYQLAQELNFDLISELIKVYWLSLVAIRDNKLKPNKEISELIRSTLIILVSLLKQRDVDLEPFIQKHNQLKEKLKFLNYEV